MTKSREKEGKMNPIKAFSNGQLNNIDSDNALFLLFHKFNKGNVNVINLEYAIQLAEESKNNGDIFIDELVEEIDLKSRGLHLSVIFYNMAVVYFQLKKPIKALEFAVASMQQNRTNIEFLDDCLGLCCASYMEATSQNCVNSKEYKNFPFHKYDSLQASYNKEQANLELRHKDGIKAFQRIYEKLCPRSNLLLKFLKSYPVKAFHEEKHDKFEEIYLLEKLLKQNKENGYVHLFGLLGMCNNQYNVFMLHSSSNGNARNDKTNENHKKVEASSLVENTDSSEMPQSANYIKEFENNDSREGSIVGDKQDIPLKASAWLEDYPIDSPAQASNISNVEDTKPPPQPISNTYRKTEFKLTNNKEINSEINVEPAASAYYSNPIQQNEISDENPSASSIRNNSVNISIVASKINPLPGNDTNGKKEKEKKKKSRRHDYSLVEIPKIYDDNEEDNTVGIGVGEVESKISTDSVT